MLRLPRKDNLDSLFKEVRVFKVCVSRGTTENTCFDTLSR